MSDNARYVNLACPAQPPQPHAYPAPNWAGPADRPGDPTAHAHASADRVEQAHSSARCWAGAGRGGVVVLDGGHMSLLLGFWDGEVPG